MSTDLLRVYFDPAEIGLDDYPYAWHGVRRTGTHEYEGFAPAIKNLIREQAGHRCERCGHPYLKGQGLNGGWSACDEHCTHGGPVRDRPAGEGGQWTERHDLRGHQAGESMYEFGPEGALRQRWEVEASWRIPLRQRWEVEASWRILTVHHLNGVKHDCRWWNLAALCQRCHLTIQGKVYLDRPWDKPHTEWFRPHAAGFYAAELLGWDLTKDEVLARTEEILQTQLRQPRLEGFA